MENYSGTLRIKNPKTLQKWINKGWYKREIDAGYIFAPNCGRFRPEKCECAKCKKINGGQALKKVLTLNGLDLNETNSKIRKSKKTKETFLCDICGNEKTGEKHKMYDENWNFDGCYECNDCFEERMNGAVGEY